MWAVLQSQGVAIFEEIGGVKLPSYRGDIINDIAFTKEARTPKPSKMIEAYFQSASLNYTSFCKGWFANLHRCMAGD